MSDGSGGQVRLGVDNKRVFAGRLLRLALTDENGAVLGRVEDVVVAPAYADKPPRVLGFVANLQRRRIFVNAGRVGTIGHTGVCLQGGTVDLRHFQARPGETLVSQLLGRRIDDEIVMDISLRLEPPAGWTVDAVALAKARAIYRRTRRIVSWQQTRSSVRQRPRGRRSCRPPGHEPDRRGHCHPRHGARPTFLVARAIPEEQLADLLEELPRGRAGPVARGHGSSAAFADVVEEMEPDDAADLLAAMPAEFRDHLLAALEPDDSESLARLLRYDASTAGGPLTPEPIIVSPEVSVAENPRSPS